MIISKTNLRWIFVAVMGIPAFGQDLTNGLVGWWRFEEGTGNRVADESGRGHDLVYAPGETPVWTNGRSGKGVYFHGVSSNSTRPTNVVYFSTTMNEGVLLTNTETSAWTLAAWVLGDGPQMGTARCIVGRPGGHAGIMAYSNSSSPNQTLELKYVNGAGSTMDTTLTSTWIDGNWHLVVVTFSNRLFTAYLDGLSVKSWSMGSNETFNITNSQLCVGGFQASGYNNPVKGTVDEVRAYRRALSPLDVASLAVPTVEVTNMGAPLVLERGALLAGRCSTGVIGGRLRLSNIGAGEVEIPLSVGAGGLWQAPLTLDGGFYALTVEVSNLGGQIARDTRDLQVVVYARIGVTMVDGSGRGIPGVRLLGPRGMVATDSRGEASLERCRVGESLSITNYLWWEGVLRTGWTNLTVADGGAMIRWELPGIFQRDTSMGTRETVAPACITGREQTIPLALPAGAGPFQVSTVTLVGLAGGRRWVLDERTSGAIPETLPVSLRSCWSQLGPGLYVLEWRLGRMGLDETQSPRYRRLIVVGR